MKEETQKTLSEFMEFISWQTQSRVGTSSLRLFGQTVIFAEYDND